MHSIPGACEHYLTPRRPYRDEIDRLLYAVLSREKKCELFRNKRKPRALHTESAQANGVIMPRPLIRDQAPVSAVVPGVARTRYIVVRQEDVWFIKFDGE